MKIYISLDMEGIPGTFSWEHEKEQRATVKTLMANHLQTVIQAIKDSRQKSLIEEILIADSHSGGDNIDYAFTALDESINLISGGPRPYYMMPAFKPDYDRVFFVGYHAGTGALHGNMDHTYSNRRIHKIKMNGIRMNEAMLNAAYAGYHGVPVSLITGDLALSKEILAEGAMPWVDFVITKEAVSKFAVKNYSCAQVNKRTTDAVLKNLSRDKSEFPLFTFKPPITLEIEFIATSMADVAMHMPGVKRLDGRTIQFREDDYSVMFEALMALVTLASTANLA